MLPKTARVRVRERALLGILGGICVQGAESLIDCLDIRICSQYKASLNVQPEPPNTHSRVFWQQMGLTLAIHFNVSRQYHDTVILLMRRSLTHSIKEVCDEVP